MSMETETIIGATELMPFTPVDRCRCRSCDASITWFDRFTAWFTSATPTRVNVSFCAGGKLPTEQAGMMKAMLTGETEHFNPCAGLTEPHLHVKCRVCGAGWLMRTKEAKR